MLLNDLPHYCELNREILLATRVVGETDLPHPAYQSVSSDGIVHRISKLTTQIDDDKP